MKKFTLLSLLIPTLFYAQENPLDIFKPFVDQHWVAVGNWNNGKVFKQEIDFEFSLNQQIVIVDTKGFINKEQTKFGLRNYGIRQYDEATKTIKFWEFDVFGNLTEGIIESNGKDLIYTYDYEGTLVTERWSYKDDNTYLYVVGVFENGEWKQQFIETEFKGKVR